MKKREVKVRNHPGIYKIYAFDETINDWKDTGKYRALRRSVKNGESVKEQQNFENFEDAKSFRLGEDPKINFIDIKRQKVSLEDQFTFAKLIEVWSEFHFMKVDYSTRLIYERTMPALKWLGGYPVESITTEVIDRLISFWMKEYPKQKRRESFDKELETIKVILNFYRRRKNARFIIPVFDEHYRAARIKRSATNQAKSLRREHIGPFFQTLKSRQNPIYFPLALTQFCLGLRIGEACGLHWKDVDLERGTAKIESTIVWDYKNGDAYIKPRPKNGKARYLAMPEILVKEFKELEKYRDKRVALVFHRSGEPLVRKSIGEVYNRALKEIGVDYVSGTHLIRKTSATQANAATGDFYGVSRFLDHATPDESMKYVEELDENKVKIAEALNSVISKALESVPQGTGNMYEGRRVQNSVPHHPFKRGGE